MDDTRDAETKGSPDLGKESSDLGKGSPDLGKGSTDLGRESSSYIRLPWPLVAAGLFGFLGVALAVGLFANRNLRPQVGPIATPIAVVAPTTPQLPTATLQPAFAQPPTTQPAAAIASTPPDARPTTTVPPAAAAPSPTPAPAATPTPAVLPTVEPLLAEEVGKAYVMFWRIRSQALLTLDTTHLDDVMDGDYLANVTRRIDELRSEGRAIKTQVVLNYSIVRATPDLASVVDDFEDKSIYVRMGTEEPLTDPEVDHLKVLYTLRHFSEAWKVVDSVGSE